MSLVGKFIFFMSEEYHQTGEIIEQVTPDIIMVRWDKLYSGSDMPGNATVLVPISLMTERDKEGNPMWEFYETRAELDAFHEWLCTPSSNPPSSPKKAKLKLIN